MFYNGDGITAPLALDGRAVLSVGVFDCSSFGVFALSDSSMIPGSVWGIGFFMVTGLVLYGWSESVAGRFTIWSGEGRSGREQVQRVGKGRRCEKAPGRHDLMRWGDSQKYQKPPRQKGGAGVEQKLDEWKRKGRGKIQPKKTY